MNIYVKETKEILKGGLEAFQFHTELHQIHFKKLSSENVLFFISSICEYFLANIDICRCLLISFISPTTITIDSSFGKAGQLQNEEH